MRNLTITLDDETGRWARQEAARLEVSVSGLVRDLLREHMTTDQSYEAAMKRYLSRKPMKLRKAGRYPSREEVHDRAGLR